MSGKENIKMENRLLWENDVIKAIRNHTNIIGQLEDDITHVLDDVQSVTIVGSKQALDNLQVEYKQVQKQKRVELFENKDVVLEQRGNKYYLSLYDKKGNFQREKSLFRSRIITRLDLEIVSKFRIPLTLSNFTVKQHII